MNWIEYCDQLGIGFSDQSKFIFVKNNVITFLASQDVYMLHSLHTSFFLMTGTLCSGTLNTYEARSWIIDVIKTKCNNFKQLISYFIAIINSVSTGNTGFKAHLLDFIEKQLTVANIKYKILNKNKDIFIFPEGAIELDDALLGEPFSWLSDYPITKDLFTRSLKQYSDQNYARDTADNLRKSFEEFLHEFFGNKKNLANNISEVGKYIKEVGGSEEITSIFKGIINAYASLNNKDVKHHDKLNPMFLEFLLYQTGLFIRMLIVVRKTTGK